MKLETYLAIRALMSADGTMHPRDRASILAVVRNHGQQPNVPAPPPQPEPQKLPAPSNVPKIISRAQAAEMLCCTTRTVDKLADQGILPRIKIPGRVRSHGVLLSDVITLIERSRHSKADADEQARDDAQRINNPIPEDELVILAQKVAYGAATPVEKGTFKGIVARL